jgi:hypothetical protein
MKRALWSEDARFAELSYQQHKTRSQNPIQTPRGCQMAAPHCFREEGQIRRKYEVEKKYLLKFQSVLVFRRGLVYNEHGIAP